MLSNPLIPVVEIGLVLIFVIHVRQFKYGTEYLDAAGVRDLYRLEMENFSNLLLVAFYVLSMAIVGSHLWHGISSAFQSLGVDNPTWTPRVLAASKVAASLGELGYNVLCFCIQDSPRRVHTSAGRSSRIPALPKFIRPVSRSPAITSRS